MDLPARFLAELQRLRLGTGPALVAVSGGADSMVLLDLLAVTRDRHGRTLTVAHVDHGIHPESRAVALQVGQRADELGVARVGTQLALGAGASETLARRERYRWLRAEQRRLGARWLFTAHHAEDQRETILMRLLRGSGPAGLAGMAGRGRGTARPLLGFSRAELLGYGAQRGLSWWEDPSNRDPSHLRSWIRHAVLPQLEERLPDVRARLSDAGRHATRDRRAWGAVLDRWPGLVLVCEGESAELDALVLEALPPGLQGVLLATLLRRLGAPAGARRIGRALGALGAKRSGMRADLGGGWQLVRHFGRLLVEPGPRAAARPPGPAAELVPPAGETRWGAWRVRWSLDTAPPVQARDGKTAWFIPGPLALRALRPGDRVAPLGGRGHRLAVRCLQEARVPARARPGWPMVVGEGHLAWIPGVCRSRELMPVAGATALRVDVDAVP